ncbi:DUF1501 domain-containing protein [Alienimonas sp. DA493]|uniref:DUF1501 domain-containing protein n=1 Tax=Alienimonas sp. DA493 TaxID=3373605 RepID=UPI00375466A2
MTPAALAHVTRRHFLRDASAGLVGGIWLSQRLAAANESAGPPAGPPHAARAKRVIHLHMVGAPSQLELFDYRPALQKYDGKDCPQEYLEGQRFAFIQGVPQLLGPQFPFEKRGESGHPVSDRLPHFAGAVPGYGCPADEVCFFKTVQSDQFNHGPAQLMAHTGDPRMGKPSVGAWTTWGLGTENENLPGFMVLLSGGRPPRAGNALWGSGFLPGVYQGVQCRSGGPAILNVENPRGVSRTARRAALDTLRELNELAHQEFGDPATLTRIEQYELAYRMQAAVPEATDLSGETKETHELYGTTDGASLANNCLLARRLAERGVRYIQLFDWGWDSHGAGKNEALNHGFKDKCREMDKPVAALIADLKRRGMLDDTLVIWGGEFGRTPMRENRGGTTMAMIGRDHNPHAFTWWMAGGGVKPGATVGETDELGYLPADTPVPLRDVHATVQHLLGFDHEKLSVPFRGLNQKLTGVKPARVVTEALA